MLGLRESSAYPDRLEAAACVVSERVARYEDSELKVLARLGREEEALDHARLRKDRREEFDGLIAIYQALAERNRTTPALLDKLVGLAHTIDDNESKACALRTLVSLLSERDDPRLSEVIENTPRAIRDMDSGYLPASTISCYEDACREAGYNILIFAQYRVIKKTVWPVSRKKG